MTKWEIKQMERDLPYNLLRDAAGNVAEAMTIFARREASIKELTEAAWGVLKDPTNSPEMLRLWRAVISIEEER